MGRRVLVVEDHPETANGLAELVGVFGHEAQVAFDGPSALEVAARTLPEVALVDLSLPGMDGFEVARRMRSFPGGEHVLLVALTGHDRDDDPARAKQAGFDYRLVKPVEPERLEDLLAGPPRGGRPS